MSRADDGTPKGPDAAANRRTPGVSQQDRAASPRALDDLLVQFMDQGPAFYVADLEGNLLHCNEQYRQLATCRADRHNTAVTPPADIQDIIECLRTLPDPLVREETLSANNYLRHYRSRHQPLTGSDGEMIAVAGLYQEITAEIHYHEIAQLALDRFNDISRLVSDWIWETDQEFRLVFVSARASEVLGLHPRALEGKSLFALGEFVPWNGDTETDMPTVDSRSPFRERPFAAPDPSGSTHLLLLSGVPMFEEESGNFIGYRGTARDATELRARERALEAAKEDAELANRTKSEFLANISHELRTPLNAILGFSETMLRSMFGAIENVRYQGYLADIHDSAKHLLTLINDILDISKAEAGKLELYEDDVDIKEIGQAAARLIQERATQGGITLTNEIGPELPLLRADERKLKQIILNLLSNAVKFTPEGGTVTLSGGIDPDGRFRISVSDTGIGMSESDIATALIAFGQVDSGLSRRYDGTGLGLPLTRALVELHDGALWVESTVGVGTAVTAKFPAERVIEKAPTMPLPPSPDHRRARH
jgi:PAS domain S-box-containing protein